MESVEISLRLAYEQNPDVHNIVLLFHGNDMLETHLCGGRPAAGVLSEEDVQAVPLLQHLRPQQIPAAVHISVIASYHFSHAQQDTVKTCRVTLINWFLQKTLRRLTRAPATMHTTCADRNNSITLNGTHFTRVYRVIELF